MISSNMKRSGTISVFWIFISNSIHSVPVDDLFLLCDKELLQFKLTKPLETTNFNVFLWQSKNESPVLMVTAAKAMN